MTFHSSKLLAEPKTEVAVSEDQLFYIQHGKEALRKAVSMLEDREGWKLEIQEVTSMYQLSFES